MGEQERRKVVVEFESDGDDEAILNEIIAVTQRLNAERRRVGGGLEIVTIQIGRTSASWRLF